MGRTRIAAGARWRGADTTPQHRSDGSATGKRKTGKGIGGRSRNTKRTQRRRAQPNAYQVHEMLLAYNTVVHGAIIWYFSTEWHRQTGVAIGLVFLVL